MTHRVAIVGAGPSGFYAADGLLRARPDLHIDIIDRLPTPYGLVRAGVAPDHQGTKAIVRQFEKLLGQPDVRFAGNIEVGRDLSWEEFDAAYDAVIVATGMVIDRKLGVPGEDLPHVWGSWRFVGWLNGHPDFRAGPDLSKAKTVAVIGNGNVALDVARVLAKSADEMAKSDIVPEAGAAIAAAPLTDIHVIGRRGPEHASFTNNELAEMGRLARAVSVTDAKALERRAARHRSDARAAAQGQEPGDPEGFCRPQGGREAGDRAFPVRRHAQGHPAGRDRAQTGTLKADLVVTCIGYSGEDFPKRDDVFPVGWAKRGPTGTIPTNRAESHAVAQQVLAFLKERDPKSGPDVLPIAVDAAGWHRIDKHEVAAGAASGRPRVKLTDWQALLDVAQDG